MFYAGWGTDTYGACNVIRGEYDSCLYFTVTLGLPVYSSFRGCVHVIEVGKIPPAQRDRLTPGTRNMPTRTRDTR